MNLDKPSKVRYLAPSKKIKEPGHGGQGSELKNITKV